MGGQGGFFLIFRVISPVSLRVKNSFFSTVLPEGGNDNDADGVSRFVDPVWNNTACHYSGGCLPFNEIPQKKKINPSPGQPEVNTTTFKTDGEPYQNKIMRLAGEEGGRLTVTDVVMATDLSIKQAEETLNKMVDGFRVRMEVLDSGIIVYEFPEIRERKTLPP